MVFNERIPVRREVPDKYVPLSAVRNPTLRYNFHDPPFRNTTPRRFAPSAVAGKSHVKSTRSIRAKSECRWHLPYAGENTAILNPFPKSPTMTLPVGAGVQAVESKAASSITSPHTSHKKFWSSNPLAAPAPSKAVWAACVT